MPCSNTEGLGSIRTVTRRASNRSERLRTKRGQRSAPGISALRLDIIWQPLHTPSENVSGRAKKVANALARPRVEQDRLGPALAGAEHVAVGEAATGGQAAHIAEIGPALEDVAHVHVDRLEPGAQEGGGHLELPVDPLLAQDGHPGPGPEVDEGRGQVGVGLEGDRRGEARIAGVEPEGLLLGGAGRIVAQGLHPEGRVGPDRAQGAAIGPEQPPAGLVDGDAGLAAQASRPGERSRSGRGGPGPPGRGPRRWGAARSPPPAPRRTGRPGRRGPAACRWPAPSRQRGPSRTG